MAGYFGRFIIEWECLKPEQYNENHGFMDWTASSHNDARSQFLEANPDYIVLNVTKKENIQCQTKRNR